MDTAAPRVVSSPGMGRIELFIVAGVALLGVGTAWLLRTGLWRRGRLAFVAASVVAGLLLLTRRVGWGELGVLAVVGAAVFLASPAPRQPPRRR